MIRTEHFDGVETVGFLIDLSNDIARVVPDLMFKPHYINKWNIDTKLYPQGICESFLVFHKSDVNNYIGTIGVSNYYKESDKPKYAITSINIQDGRQTYSDDGNYKYSIHAKNIIRIAKKVFKPFTFDQIADRCKREFAGKIDALRNSLKWELRQRTCDGYEHLIDDWENLFHLGYEPKNAKFKQMMEYIMANKAKIDKYRDYNPDHYFVLVKDNQVQYRLNTNKNQAPVVLPSKDALPDEIKGKLFVLDITDKKDFVEDVGLKENDGAYWIIA